MSRGLLDIFRQLAPVEINAHIGRYLSTQCFFVLVVYNVVVTFNMNVETRDGLKWNRL